ncbi:hypothetical protein BKA70DRAFT_1296238 [Coprinopsis sp. MPI-PUGE-AT-0042]|nr:hypothetical protein BKA70DRAFT_1296238 [Coprinopsis sp. MPI-PUGE-AT-0042]
MLVATHVPQQREATRPYSKYPRIACTSFPPRFIHTGSHHASISSLLVVVPILYAMKVIPPLLKTLGMYFNSHVSVKALVWIYIAFSFTAGTLRSLSDKGTSCLLPCPCRCSLDRVCAFNSTAYSIALVSYIL